MNTTEIALNITTCVIVAAAMWFILTKFLKRLRQIEIERWGDTAKFDDGDSFRSILKLLMTKTPKETKTEK